MQHTEHLYHVHLAMHVYRAGSYRKAAEMLNLSHTTLARRIHRFESASRIQLFYRCGRRVTLTPDGFRLFNRIEGHLRRIDDEIGALSTTTATAYTVTVSPDLYHLIPDLAHILNDLRSPQLSFIPGNRGDSDISVISGLTTSNNSDHRQCLGDIHWKIFTKCGLRPDILKAPLFRTADSPLLDPRDLDFFSQTLTLESLAAVRDAMNSGAGFGLLPIHLITENNRADCFPMRQIKWSSRLWLQFDHRVSFQPLVADLVRELRAVLESMQKAAHSGSRPHRESHHRHPILDSARPRHRDSDRSHARAIGEPDYPKPPH